MTPVEIIRQKRMGGALGAQEIADFARGAADGSWADYQLSAMLMAIAIRGMDERETVDLTMAMAHSGRVLDLSAIDGVKVDKHSTGGVGDTTTLIVAPLVAACGAKVAKMSGRGLGFTGGTLDKLESIPGFQTNLPIGRFIDAVRSVGLAVVGQSDDLAPADRALYALRDVTATVDSLPLIASSILSKKIAAGCDAVVLDVKAGSGAMMPTVAAARELAAAMVGIGRRTGRRYAALVTDMNQPLGMNVGNALEVKEAVAALSGQVRGPLVEVSLALGAEMLLSAGAADTREGATAALEAALASGAGLGKLARMIEAQGGDRRVTEDVGLLPAARAIRPVAARQSGYLAAIRASDIGNAALALGAGRAVKSDAPDPAAGLVMKKRLGDRVEAGEPIAEMHLVPRSDAGRAEVLILGALDLSPIPPAPQPLIYALID